MTGMVSREEALRWQSQADGLVLVDHVRSHPSTNIPSKCYEYLATGRPVIALTPEGATRDLLQEVGAGSCVEPNDGAGALSAIRLLIDAKRAGRLKQLAVSGERLRPYHRETTARVLASCFAEVSG